MHILYITPNFPPEVNAGATRAYEHARRWVDAGCRVTVIAPAPNWPRGRLYSGYENRWHVIEELDGIEVHRVWTLIRPNQGIVGRTASFISYFLHAIFRALQLRKAGWDVVLATSPHFFSGLAGAVVRKLTRRPLALEIRDIWPESIVAVGAVHSRLLIRLLERLEHWMYASADSLITVGPGYRDKLLERGVLQPSIPIVPNGVDLQRWQPRPANVELRRRWGARDDQIVCAYVGTIGLAHGLEVVLEAARVAQQQERDNLVFWIVGEGANRIPLQQRAEALGLRNVHFPGQCDKDLVAEILASADACLVHLRPTELFATVTPSKIFEAMAMRCPIVMGVDGPAADLVMKAGAGVRMKPGDSSSLLSALDQINCDRDLYTQGRSYVARNYCRNQLAARMQDELARLAPHRATVPQPSRRAA